MNSIDLAESFPVTQQQAPFDPRGSDYNVRWRRVTIKGKECWVIDPAGTHVMRGGRPTLA